VETLAVDLLLAVDFAAVLTRIWSAGSMVLGLGLVIFFHELGHFAVAKWCDVHVERFSIGFGPILWSRQKGETEYALSLIPFGGYVKMLGQDDMDASQMANEDIAENPRSYSAKKVWQRMAIISAGVIMNIITAAMFYMLAYGIGVQDAPATVGAVSVGSPAWQEGLKLGDKITHINDEEMETFSDISMEVALTKGPIKVRGIHPDGTEFTKTLTPEAGNVRQIGIFPISNTHVIQPLDEEDSVTSPGFPADKADPPFLPGDSIVSIDGQSVTDFAQVKTILSDNRDKSVIFELQRLGEDDKPGETVSTTVEPMKFRSLGFSMEMGPVAAIQTDSPAAKAGLQIGDVIKTVDGKQLGTEIDPLQLPDYLATKAGSPTKIGVLRKVEGSADSGVTLEMLPENIRGWKQAPFSQDEPFSADSIGAAYFVSTRIAAVKPGSEAARVGLRKSQKVVKLEIVSPDKSNTMALELEPEEGEKADEINWAVAYWSCQQLLDHEIILHVREEDKTVALTLKEYETEANLFMPVRGFKTELLLETQQTSGIGATIKSGVQRTWKNVLQIYLTLRGLFTGRISVKELKGPLGIGEIGYKVAKQGTSELLKFLGFLSVNLAVLNFLPIPVLDGGHMVFLTYEAVAGKKPSEKILIAAQYLGLIMILSLMVFVLGQDFYRLLT
jgi:regulator of sigma E protease